MSDNKFPFPKFAKNVKTDVDFVKISLKKLFFSDKNKNHLFATIYRIYVEQGGDKSKNDVYEIFSDHLKHWKVDTSYDFVTDPVFDFNNWVELLRSENKRFIKNCSITTYDALYPTHSIVNGKMKKNSCLTYEDMRNLDYSEPDRGTGFMVRKIASLPNQNCVYSRNVDKLYDGSLKSRDWSKENRVYIREQPNAYKVLGNFHPTKWY